MPTPESSLPRQLERYALYDRIASGGMASVHIGRLVGPVGFSRTVAIKRMHPHVAEDPEFVSMFLDEAQLAARVQHPNVVPTLDVVATGGELFLVMEYVPGETLARLVQAAAKRHERIPPGMVASIMAGVLHGLHAAHEAKSDQGGPLCIVHRDVSPHNILVGTDGVARVLDFGVAKATGRLQTTREGQIKGKLSYMAPEQVRGTATRATDVYAASVVLWEALTAKRLFRGENDAHVLDQVLKGCTEPPSKYAEGLPPALDVVTMRGLSVDPSERFPTARDMGRALEAALPLTTASQIGDWVLDVAREALAERQALVAHIESGSDARVLPRRPPAPTLTAPSATKPETPEGLRETAEAQAGPNVEGASGTLADETIPTQLSSGSVSSPGRPPPMWTRSRTLSLAGTCGGLLVAAAIVVGVSRPTSTARTPPVQIAPRVEPVQMPASSLPVSPGATASSLPDASSPSIVSWDELPITPAAESGVSGRAAPARRSPGQTVRPPPATPPPSPTKAPYNPMEHL